MTRRADVVVVGAGLSGLAAARRLAAAGVDVAVLDAKPRVGGRTRNDVLPDGCVVDAGAMYVCDGQDAILGLADALGVERYPAHTAGADVCVYAGERMTFTGGLPPLPDADAAAAQDGLREFGRVAATVPAAAPWDAPDADPLDAMSVAAWRDQTIASPGARFLFDAFVSGWPCAEPGRVSLLYLLHVVAACGGLREMLTVQGQTFRFAGGAQSLALRARAELGERVLVGVPVHTISQSASEARVEAHGAVVTAQHVIVTPNPAGCRLLRFEPQLPPARLAYQDGWHAGPLLKLNVVYSEPFWRGDGLSGNGYTDLPAAPAFLDATPPDSSYGVLAVAIFVLAAEAAKGNPPAFYADPAVRRAAVLDALVRCLGPRAAEPVNVLEGDWLQDPYTFGCEGSTPPGLLTRVREAVHAPMGRVHWAGTDGAHNWPGWMNGAVDAGERAAAQVLAAL